MGHQIGYLTFEKDATKYDILAEIYERALAGDGYDDTQMHWHRDKTYDSYESAMAAIDDMDRGDYDDHAVLFLEYPDDEVEAPNKTEVQARESLAAAKEALSRYVDAHHVYRRKSEFIGCMACGSKLARTHLGPNQRHRLDICPVCGADLRPPSTLERERALKERVSRAEQKVRTLERRRYERWHKQCKNRAKTMWLVKYEFHV